MLLPDCSAMHLLVHIRRHCASSCAGCQCRVASSTNCVSRLRLCAAGSSRSARHHSLNDLVWRGLSTTSIPTTKESSGLIFLGYNEKRFLEERQMHDGQVRAAGTVTQFHASCWNSGTESSETLKVAFFKCLTIIARAPSVCQRINAVAYQTTFAHTRTEDDI